VEKKKKLKMQAVFDKNNLKKKIAMQYATALIDQR